MASRHVQTERQRELDRRFEAVTGIASHEVEIKDAQAIRALAHDARQRVINVLYTQQRPFTSTELAELTGLTPSAMSYHLRALERWGVVERAPEAADGRQRPWRASGTSLRIGDEGHGGEAADAAEEALRLQMIRALGRRLRAARDLPPQERARYVGISTGELWLTPEQTETVGLLLENALLELLESGWVNEPGEGKTRVAFVWSLLPDPLT